MNAQINVHDLAAKLTAQEPVYLLDVRQPWEKELASLPGSVLVPLHELPGRADELQPPEGALVVVYCHLGVRSRSAAEFLRQRGWKQVTSLAGGIDAWSLEIDPSVPRY